MSLPRGRVLRATSEGVFAPIVVEHVPAMRPRRLDREILAAKERAASIVAAAELEAASIIEQAERRAAEIELDAELSGRSDGLACLAAVGTALAERESRADENALDRVVTYAGLVAERTLHEALAESPERIVRVARRVLDEARGARTAAVCAHPEDAPILERALSLFDGESRVRAVIPDASLCRGDLRIETDLGVIDARLGTRIGLLVERLRQVLQNE